MTDSTQNPEFETITEDEIDGPDRPAPAPAPEAEHADGETAPETEAEAENTAQPETAAQQTAADRQAQVILDDAYFRGKPGSFNGEEWIDSVMKPFEDALDKPEAMDEMLVKLFFAFPQSVLNMAVNALEQYNRDVDRRMKEGQENRERTFNERMQTRQDFCKLAAESFQRWSMMGAQQTAGSLTSEQKAQGKAFQFMMSLPRTQEGTLNWNAMTNKQRKAYASALSNYVAKNREFHVLVARELGMVLDKDELKTISSGAKQYEPTVFQVTGSMRDAEVRSTDGGRETADAVDPSREVTEHNTATDIHNANVNQAELEQIAINRERDNEPARVPSRPGRTPTRTPEGREA